MSGERIYLISSDPEITSSFLSISAGDMYLVIPVAHSNATACEKTIGNTEKKIP